MGFPFSLTQSQIRPATPDDTEILARLADLAGEGLPSHLWSKMATEEMTPLEVGKTRAARTEGSFSYCNARIATSHGAPVGTVIDYDIDVPEGGDAPPLLAPLIALEAHATQTRYVNVLAVLPQSRNKGIASALLEDVVARTQRDLMLIVSSGNRKARAMYVSKGFEEVAREAMGPGGPSHLAGYWILMRRKAGEIK